MRKEANFSQGVEWIHHFRSWRKFYFNILPGCSGPAADIVKSAFTKVLAAVRSGLERQAPASVDHGPASPSMPAAAAVRRTELVSQFASELERVNGHFMGAIAPDEMAAKIFERIRKLGARSVAVGEAVVLDLATILQRLGRSEIELVRCGKTNDEERRSLREKLAACDLAVVEAHYAIASTGTLVVVATPGRPGSLTLLPPVNILLVDASRVLPNMAAVVSALGPETITQHRIAFITGPSRTADIEKMIVLGVHGPKELYAAVVWPGDNNDNGRGSV